MIRERGLGGPVEEISTSTGRESDDPDEAAQGTFVFYIRTGPDERDGALTPDAGDEEGVVDVRGFGQVSQDLFTEHFAAISKQTRISSSSVR
jgi:hypothetical protein